MQEEWWKKLSSESVKDRLPVVWMMAKVGLVLYLVILTMLLVLLPWKKETKPVSSFRQSSRSVIRELANKLDQTYSDSLSTGQRSL